jgi:hypothetical protein
MFTNPYISGELARDRQRELRAQAARQHPTRPGAFMIRIAFAGAALTALAAGAAGAHAAVNPHAMSAHAAATVWAPKHEAPSVKTITWP